MSKQNVKFSSVFEPNFEVNVYTYITELLIENKLELWKKPKPKTAFWRKGMAEKNDGFSKLRDDYLRELPYVKKLLKCFYATVIIKYIKERNLITLVYNKKARQQEIIYDLWQYHCKYDKEITEQAKKNKGKEKEDPVLFVQHRESKKTKLSGL